MIGWEGWYLRWIYLYILYILGRSGSAAFQVHAMRERDNPFPDLT